MKVIVPNFVKKDFEKWCNLFESLLFLIYRKFRLEHFYLKRPFVKIKLNICNKAYRLVAYYRQDIDVLLVLGVYEKKSKLFWENIRRESIKDTVELLLKKAYLELEKWNIIEKSF